MATLLKSMVIAALVFYAQSVFSAIEEYKLGPGDTITVSVYEQPDLTTTARISESGKITFPLLGEVSVVGLTTAEVESKIAKSLKDGGFIKQPQVTVNIKSYLSKQVVVLGEVNKPGKYPIEGVSVVSDLLAQAGGRNKEAADIIFVIKKGSKGISKYQVNVADFYLGDLSQNIEVSNGDMILVPHMDVFYIYGEVNHAGVFRLERNMTVMQALSLAGGLTGRGTDSGIRVNRRDSKGHIQSVQVELTDLLKPDDVVYVKERLF